MLFQVNFKFVHETGKLRSSAHVLEAKDTKEARAAAIKAIKADYDHFEITSIKTFGQSQG